MRKIDLSGQVYGRLTVLGDIGKRTNNKEILWQCICECGTIAYTKSSHLKSGAIRSCGCLNREVQSKRRTQDLIGYEDNNFKVIRRIGSTRHSKALWEVECKHCGQLAELTGNALKNQKSCGCLKKGASKEYMASIMDPESLKSTKPTAKSTTGVRGVYFNKQKGSYTAFINVNKKNYLPWLVKEF